MDDLISKRFIQDALIEKISNLNAEGATQTARELIRLKKFVDGLTPPASAEAEWIRCSEKLPEKEELVLVTVWNDVTIAWRNIYGGWDSAEDMYEKGDVIAWMPLPKPYKGGDAE